MPLLEHLLHVGALDGAEDGVRVETFFLVHEEGAELRGLGPVGEGGGFGLGGVGGGGGGGGRGVLFAVGGDVVEVDVFAVLILGGGFRWRGKFGLVGGSVGGRLLCLLLWPMSCWGVGYVGEGDLAVGKLFDIWVIAWSEDLLRMGVLLVSLVLGS